MAKSVKVSPHRSRVGNSQPPEQTRAPLSPPSALKVRLRVVRGEEDAFGPGKAQLVESLLETGSLNRSASAMKMSYVKALALARAMNAHFHTPLVALTRGGKHGGGAQVTETGRKVLAESRDARGVRGSGAAGMATAAQAAQNLSGYLGGSSGRFTG